MNRLGVFPSSEPVASFSSSGSVLIQARAASSRAGGEDGGRGGGRGRTEKEGSGAHTWVAGGTRVAQTRGPEGLRGGLVWPGCGPHSIRWKWADDKQGGSLMGSDSQQGHVLPSPHGREMCRHLAAPAPTPPLSPPKLPGEPNPNPVRPCARSPRAPPTPSSLPAPPAPPTPTSLPAPPAPSCRLLGAAVDAHPVMRRSPRWLSPFHCGVMYLWRKAQILQHPVGGVLTNAPSA